MNNLPHDFNPEIYKSLYDDLKHMQTSEEALEHWVSHGKNEGRKMYTITD